MGKWSRRCVSDRGMFKEFGAVTCLIASLVPGSRGQDPTAVGPIFRSEVNLVSIAVRVTDRQDNEIHGLTADRFALYQDGIRQKTSFFAAEEEPVSLGILLDVSNSMASTDKLDQAKHALAPLVRGMRPEDEMFYLQFHRQVDKIVDFTSDPQRILAAIGKTGVKQDGTSLYDAVAKALCYAGKSHRHRRALLVITDGADQHSHRLLDELIPIVQASQAQVFIIGYFDNAEYELYRDSRSPKVTLVTSQEIDNPVMVFRRLANESGELRTQYTLAYFNLNPMEADSVRRGAGSQRPIARRHAGTRS